MVVGSVTRGCQVVVIGAGPGGYTAAFRAADLGLKVALVERYDALGGVCLNVGCIPSKALLHTAAVIDEAAAMAAHGVKFGEPEIDIDSLRAHKEDVVAKLTGGLAGMARQRGVEVIEGVAAFTSVNELEVSTEKGSKSVVFRNAIIAVGSRSIELPNMPWGDPRLMDSTAALEIRDVPGRLLVVGGGYIGLELGTVYAALGSRVTVVENGVLRNFLTSRSPIENFPRSNGHGRRAPGRCRSSGPRLQRATATQSELSSIPSILRHGRTNARIRGV